MSDKTCGTCQRLETHRAPLHGRYICYYNASIASNGVEIPEPRSEDDAACESWIKRTDSLEAIAKEAVRAIQCCQEDKCRHCPLEGKRPFCSDELADRLEELGVEL